jgi:hypothetical protein
MELSELKKLELRAVEDDFNGLKITVNVNAVTGRLFRDAAAQIKLVEYAQKAAQEKQQAIADQSATLGARIDEMTAALALAGDQETKEGLSLELAALQKELGDLEPSTVEIFEGRGRETEAICELYARLIKGAEDTPLLLSWDLTNSGRAVECSEAEIRKLHPNLLKDLYQFCLRVYRPKLQETRTTATSRTISDSTVASTHTPDTQTDANPIM